MSSPAGWSLAGVLALFVGTTLAACGTDSNHQATSGPSTRTSDAQRDADGGTNDASAVTQSPWRDGSVADVEDLNHLDSAAPPPAGNGHADSGAGDAGDASAPDGNGVQLPVDAGRSPISCPSSALRPGESSGSLSFGGLNRSYRVYAPTGYRSDLATPLVVWFHGILGSSRDYQTSGFREVADREGFLLVAPDGIDQAWNIGPCCTARRRNIDDVGFAKALVQKLAQTACIDPSRVYAAGFSMGGGMSHYLGCQAADVFAAVAPSAFDLLQENVDGCKPVRPISVASFRNRWDNFVYYDGVSDSEPPNTFVTGDSTLRINILGAEATFAAWARIDGCSGSAIDDGPGCRTYKSCVQGTEVTLCSEDDVIGGHKPGPADQMWERLKRFSLP